MIILITAVVIMKLIKILIKMLVTMTVNDENIKCVDSFINVCNNDINNNVHYINDNN